MTWIQAVSCATELGSAAQTPALGGDHGLKHCPQGDAPSISLMLWDLVATRLTQVLEMFPQLFPAGGSSGRGLGAQLAVVQLSPGVVQGSC